MGAQRFAIVRSRKTKGDILIFTAMFNSHASVKVRYFSIYFFSFGYSPLIAILFRIQHKYKSNVSKSEYGRVCTFARVSKACKLLVNNNA